MTARKLLPILGAVGVVGAVWWITRPRGSVTLGDLTQPIRGAGDDTVIDLNDFERGSQRVGGLEPPALAMQRPENLSGQGLSNAEVDRKLQAYYADLAAHGIQRYH